MWIVEDGKTIVTIEDAQVSLWNTSDLKQVRKLTT